jgi:thioesterase domain-containing protein
LSLRDVADIYPLSPLQESLLSRALASGGTGAGFEQTTCALYGDLDAEAFEQTWQRVVDRHPILRTAFLFEGLDKPLQVVRQQAILPFERHDWRDLSADEQRARLEAFLAADQERGFDPARAPLMRVAIIRLAEQAWQLVWSHHHLLLDGWCRGLIQREILAFYAAFRRGEDLDLPRSRPFRDYIEWLQRQDGTEARGFWRQLLAGVAGPTPLMVDRLPAADSSGEGRYERREIRLSAATGEVVERLARRAKVTPNTVVQGAWALLLSRYSGREDVVFGTAVSGRPADLPHVESMMGMFINNLPVRVQVPADATPAAWLGTLQDLLVELRRFEYLPPEEVQELSGAPPGVRLFESLVLYQSYPAGPFAGTAADGPAAEGPAAALAIRAYRVRLETGYPLTLVVVPRQTWELRLHFDRGRFGAAAIERMLGHLEVLLQSLAEASAGPLASLPLLRDAERHQLLVEGAGPYVLDRLLAAVPIGIPGELWVGGEGLAQGPGDPGARLARTGDLARWLSGRELEHLGRADRWVVLGGLPVLLGEVEAVLRRQPEVGDAAVTTWREVDGTERLIAHLEPCQGRALDPGEIRRRMRRHLPEPMIPSAFALEGPLPRTADGRIDRDALPPPRALGAGLREALVGPRTPLELRLVQVWEDLLGIHPLGVTDDFFSLGGHSLLAVRLINRIHSELGRELALTALLEASTVAAIAAVLEAGAPPPGAGSLVKLQTGGARPPLVAVHPMGGGVLCYVELAYQLGSGQPFYGLQAAGWQDERDPVSRIERMAALYLEELREAQPRGPYHLLGWSFGGFVAFEMARQLTAAGETVALLAILDTHISQRAAADLDAAEFLAQRLGGEMPLPVEELRRLGGIDAQMDHLIERARQAGRLAPDFDEARSRRLLKLEQAHQNAARAYLPRPYPGELLLLRSAETVEMGLADPTLGWGDLALGGVEIQDVPGRHRDLVQRPWVRAVAERLRDGLERSAEAGAGAAERLRAGGARLRPRGVGRCHS